MQLSDTSAQEGVRRVALAPLKQARTAAAQLGDASPGDHERTLHALRVSLRRLRSCLRAYETVLEPALPTKLRRRLRKIARATNPGRDAEVQRAWVARFGEAAEPHERAGMRWLEARLAAEASAHYGDIRGAVLSDFGAVDARLQKRLSEYSLCFTVGRGHGQPRFGQVAADAIETHLDALVNGLGQVESTADEEKAHDARIDGKRLRYLIEPLRAEHKAAKALVKRLKRLQDLLGDLQDLYFLRGTVGQALEERALAQARQLRAAAEDGRLGEALEADERAGLIALLARIAERRTAQFEVLFELWLSGEGELTRLAADVRRFCAHLRHEPVEIERKYLLSTVPPEVHNHPFVEIDQGYLPGSRITERVRRTRREDGEKLVRTVKYGRTLRRIELQEKLTPEVFGTFWRLTEGRRVEKRRYIVPAGELVWEVDVFSDRDLVLAEIELPSEDTEVVLPAWLAPHVVRDVTDEPDYLNVHLAK
ncbi:MAG: CHAD domain-containing protein [Sandaracinaceae bacterium]